MGDALEAAMWMLDIATGHTDPPKQKKCASREIATLDFDDVSIHAPTQDTTEELPF